MNRAPAALTLSAVLSLGTLATAAPASAATPFPDTVPLAAGSQPEGIASGPGTTAYAGSRADGAVYVLDLRTGSRTLLVPGTEGSAARGLQLDPRTGLLWVAGDVTVDGELHGAVTAYDRRTGALVVQYDLGPGRFLNDVQVVDGTAYVTDSLHPELVVATAQGYDLLPLTGDFTQPAAGGFGLNGIRALPGGDLVVTDSSTGDLLRADRTTGVTDRIELSGPDLTSGDGLELRGNTLYVVYGFSTDGVAVVRLEQGGRTGTVQPQPLTDPDLDRPTTAVLAAGALYAVNGRFSTPPTPTTPYDVVRVALR